MVKMLVEVENIQCILHETNKATNNVKTWNGKKLTDKKSQTGNDLGSYFKF